MLEEFDFIKNGFGVLGRGHDGLERNMSVHSGVGRLDGLVIICQPDKTSPPNVDVVISACYAEDGSPGLAR